ncbi:hypothetical protein FRC03_012898 [Tulasnella sp. 419]|nr:hypothetical protein FRC03_012898 [Tulasnella sp. 419]
MAECPDCLNDFPNKSTDGPCQKCIKINSASTKQEKDAYRDYGQCRGCGITAKNLNNVCGRCNKPKEATLSANQSGHASTKEIASRALQIAEEHRSNATQFRIPSRGAGVHTATKRVVQGRLDARQLAKMKTVEFVLAGISYTVMVPGGNMKLKDSSALADSKLWPLESEMYEVFKYVRASTRSSWKKMKLDEIVGSIDDTNIEIALVVQKQNHTLKEDDYKTKTVKEALDQLALSLSWTDTKNTKVPLRAIVRIHENQPDDDEIQEVTPPKKRARRAKQLASDDKEVSFMPSALSSRPRLSRAETPKFLSSLADPASACLSNFWSSSPASIVTHKSFTKINAICEIGPNNELIQRIELDPKSEVLVVHHTSQGIEPDQKAEGYFKGCIKGLHDGKDVVIAIAEGRENINYSAEDNYNLVIQESRALALGRLLTELFYKKLRQVGKRVAHQFTFNSSFVADFGPTSQETESFYRTTKKVLARRYALVSPLLPNWPRDFVRFCGARCDFEEVVYGKRYEFNISQEVYDSLKPVIEAFNHYVYAETGCTVVFADIQGAWSSDQSLFIIADPQVHTSSCDGKNPAPWASWDSKEEGISTFFELHACNDICKALGLDVPELKYDIAGGAIKGKFKNLMNNRNRSPLGGNKKRKQGE